MRQAKSALLGIVMALVAIALFIYLRKEPSRKNPTASPVSTVTEPVAGPPATTTTPPTPTVKQSAPVPTVYATTRVAGPRETARPVYPLQFTNIPPDRVLDNMRIVFHEYASMFGGNPVGTNPEITSSLNGNNPKQVNFINPEAGMRIDAQGEMIDPWGTPFFFHQLSGRVMEIHSAGPDRVMWSDDDLVIK
ncbi:MAG TPA: hypothetical protein VH619_02315 [Verrucomicrobiae bacterium]|jgi:hypothetical protein|nr:hypothetical protein [Verrucomicrobiae bacterium]